MYKASTKFIGYPCRV